MVFVVNFIATAGGPAVTGNFRRDVMIQQLDSITTQSSVIVVSPYHQNPFVNGFYSLVLPGAGQFQSERYTKAAIFLGAELAFIAYAVLSDKNGDKKTAEFQKYAEAHWSAERYAQWIRMYGVADYGPATSIDMDKVRQNDFAEINAWESASGPNKIGFSHQLPRYGDQQYYELIGKYYQFKFGWDAYPTDAKGIPQSDNRDYFNNFTADKQIKNYAAERGKANDYYYAASFALSALVINHALSAIDAFLSTKSFNQELSASLQLTPVDGMEGKRLMSQVKVSVGF